MNVPESSVRVSDTLSALSEQETAALWNLFQAIDRFWGGPEVQVENMAGQWREFIYVKCEREPSYTETYRQACKTLDDLRTQHGESRFEYLFLDPSVQTEVTTNPTSELSQLKVRVVDEFLRVYVSAGGFRAYGGTNYGGFVSGSRYRARAPYRIAEGV